MKTAIRCLLGILILALAWVLVIEIAYGVPNPSTKRIAIGMLMFLGMMFLAIYVIEPAIVHKRVYAIVICLSARRRIHSIINGMAYGIFSKRDFIHSELGRLTGCYTYFELYHYAKQEYFAR